MYIYHYYAEYRLVSGDIATCDGTIERKHKIRGWEDYQAVKSEIANMMGFSVLPGEIIVKSLSLI